LDLASSLGGSNPKNYQIWYHRRALLESHGAHEFLDSELNYIAEVLQEDPKNYHAWSYRQWIIMTVNDEPVWEKEIKFASKLIQEDIRNNSAWNQRWFAIHRGKHRGGGHLVLNFDVARQEADFAIDHARLDPYNESPWRYLIGILREQQQEKSSKADIIVENHIVEYEAKASNELRNVLTDAFRDPDACVNMTSARIELLEMIGKKDELETAVELAEGLANEYDIIRKKYWILVLNRLRRRLSLIN